MVEIFDHEGRPVTHGRAHVNGIRMHYVTAGRGAPLLLLHGTPKNHFYWHKLIPLLTEHFTVVAPDLRGFGHTDKPPATEGYDSLTNATDLTELMLQLGHSQFHIHGEDRGAEYGYVLAATRPDMVRTLSFAEMLLSKGSKNGPNSPPSMSPPSTTNRAYGYGTSRFSGCPTYLKC
jgi:pimeloyl-ACP methyl ester carboxylesterase